MAATKKKPGKPKTKTDPAAHGPRVLGISTHPVGIQSYEHAIVEVPPISLSARFSFHHYDPKPTSIDLALPWTYYKTQRTKMNGGGDWLVVERVGARPSQATADDHELYILPVPNSQNGGFVCIHTSYSLDNTDALTPELRAGRAVNDYWAGLFTYQVSLTMAHANLLNLAGASLEVMTYTRYSPKASQEFLAPYQLWSTWTPEEVLAFPWGQISIGWPGDRNGSIKDLGVPDLDL